MSPFRLCPTHPPPPTFNLPTHPCLCPWVLYTYITDKTWGFFLSLHDLALRFSCPKAKTVMNLVDAFAFQCLYIGSDLHIHSSFPKTNLNTHILHLGSLSSHLPQLCILSFSVKYIHLFQHFIFLILYLFIFREGKGGRNTSRCSCLSYTPNWGPGLKPRHVSLLGIEPVTFQFTGWWSVHWTTPARAHFSTLNDEQHYLWNNLHFILFLCFFIILLLFN